MSPDYVQHPFASYVYQRPIAQRYLPKWVLLVQSNVSTGVAVVATVAGKRPIVDAADFEQPDANTEFEAYLEFMDHQQALGHAIDLWIIDNCKLIEGTCDRLSKRETHSGHSVSTESQRYPGRKITLDAKTPHTDRPTVALPPSRGARVMHEVQCLHYTAPPSMLS